MDDGSSRLRSRARERARVHFRTGREPAAREVWIRQAAERRVVVPQSWASWLTRHALSILDNVQAKGTRLHASVPFTAGHLLQRGLVCDHHVHLGPDGNLVAIVEVNADPCAKASVELANHQGRQLPDPVDSVPEVALQRQRHREPRLFLLERGVAKVGERPVEHSRLAGVQRRQRVPRVDAVLVHSPHAEAETRMRM